jgi:hypothetical protein
MICEPTRENLSRVGYIQEIPLIKPNVNITTPWHNSLIPQLSTNCRNTAHFSISIKQSVVTTVFSNAQKK